LRIGDYIAIYGAGTNFTITVDPSSEQPYTETFSNRNETGRNELYKNWDKPFTNTPHTVEIVNEGESLLLDLIVFPVQLGASG
jgi:hypothetical protein